MLILSKKMKFWRCMILYCAFGWIEVGFRFYVEFRYIEARILLVACDLSLVGMKLWNAWYYVMIRMN